MRTQSLEIRTRLRLNPVLVIAYGCWLPALGWAQLTEAIPPPTAPGNPITNLASGTGYVRVESQPGRVLDRTGAEHTETTSSTNRCR